MKSSHAEIMSFTLVELLVVVGIIGILAALVLPSLSKAKGSGDRMQCVNNLHQIGKTLELYTQENNYFFPRRGQTTRDADIIPQ